MSLLRYECFICIVWKECCFRFLWVPVLPVLWRMWAFHRMIIVSLGITTHLNLRSSFFSRSLRRSAAQPLPSPRCGCALMADVPQGWWVLTMRQAISDLISSSVFIASEFLPLNSTAWGFPKGGNMGDMCRHKWRWLAMVSKGSVFRGVEVMQREGKKTKTNH